MQVQKAPLVVGDLGASELVGRRREILESILHRCQTRQDLHGHARPLDPLNQGFEFAEQFL
jgi:hypothetical protein